jgi:hypothetical protein
MAANEKAGVPFWIKIDTNKDLMGSDIADGFTAQYFNDSTGVLVDITNGTTIKFTEIMNSIASPSTGTLAQDALKGSKVIVLGAGEGINFPAGKTIRIGASEYNYVTKRTVDTLILKSPLDSNVSSGASVTEVGNTGIYRCQATIASIGNYTVVVKNDIAGMQHTAFPVNVKAANIDDVKTLLDTMNSNLDAVKTQVDLLDEEELNTIKAAVDGITTQLTNLTTLIGPDANGTDGLDTLMEYIDAINTAVADSAGLAALTDMFNSRFKTTDVKGEVIQYLDNVQSQLQDAIESGSNDKIYLLKVLAGETQDTIVPEEDILAAVVTNGLPHIFNKVVQETNEIDSAIEAVQEAITLGGSLYTHVTTVSTTLQTAIETAIDNAKTALIVETDAIKTIVQANQSALDSSVFGLSAIKTLIDTTITDIDAAHTDITAVQTSIGTLNTAIVDHKTDILDAIEAAKVSIENKIDALNADITTKMDTFADSQSYKAFV